MRKAWTITGYTYKAECWCPRCLVAVLQKEQRLTLAASDMAVEDALDQLAAYDLVDRNDESSYDSDDFPKVIFASDDDEIVCGGCNKFITDL